MIMATDLPSRPPHDPNEQQSIIDPTDRVKSAADKPDPRFEAARQKAAREEVTRHALDRASYRLLFDHPTTDRFTDTEFLTELECHRLRVRGHRTVFFGDFVLGAAGRTP